MPNKSGDETTEPANLTANLQLLRHIISGQKTAEQQKRIRVNQRYSQNRACWIVGDLTKSFNIDATSVCDNAKAKRRFFARRSYLGKRSTITKRYSGDCYKLVSNVKRDRGQRSYSVNTGNIRTVCRLLE